MSSECNILCTIAGRAIVPLEALLQDLRLPIVQVKDHLSEQAVCPREPAHTISCCLVRNVWWEGLTTDESSRSR